MRGAIGVKLPGIAVRAPSPSKEGGGGGVEAGGIEVAAGGVEAGRNTVRSASELPDSSWSVTIWVARSSSALLLPGRP
jgi:hypothetical protein